MIINKILNNFAQLIVDERGFFEKIWNWLETNGLKIALIVAIAYAVIRIGSKFLGRVIYQFVKIHHRHGTEKDIRQRSDTLNSIVGTSFTVIVWAIVLMVSLSEVGINVGPLIAGAGVVGLAIGFGAQTLVRDFMTGLFIITENQYRVGDIVRLYAIGGVTVDGVVEAVTMRTTILRDLDGNVHHFPNGEIKVSTNMTLEHSAVNINVKVDYKSDIKKVESVINKVGIDLANNENWHKKVIEAPHFERIENLGDGAVEIKILGKTKPMAQWTVAGEFRKRLKIAFDENKIKIV
ncbi:mechanosensitive ion channel family protein [Candidatus Saccharibacteria bacterium CPR2]|nr:mechanosensitive ion channel family protein [Candidatus Saccharibacteria bacterium CPR2]